MKLSVSNIAWDSSQDAEMYAFLRQSGFHGVEIAPTRLFPLEPYAKLAAAKAWAYDLRRKYGLAVPSMQSIWYGRGEKIFGDEADRNTLLEYTNKAMVFATTVGCPHLVFGCPKNRNRPERADAKIGVNFFRNVANIAVRYHVTVGLEANPPIYGTNYLNTTRETLALVREINSPGLGLNLDVGTLIENGEGVDILSGAAQFISHVHISEPYLKPIQPRALHRELAAWLNAVGYDGFVSIEMGRREGANLRELKEAMAYVGGVFRAQ
ncbi:MAG: sugar phosphate isomerase/epimerase [Selenomonadaceae bacterium]|nr:sugar phosphate isomerase/epimerase [Selenomonadaceae bacterium]